MNNKFIIISLFGVVLISTAHSANPVWTFTPVAEYPNSVTVSTTGRETIKYTIVNQSHKVHTLEMKPIQGITPSGCTSALEYHQSCILSLEVNGSILHGDVTGGPVLCEKGSSLQCHQPSRINGLRIIRGQGITLVAAGFYSDRSKVRPLLALSSNSGETWSYPESLTRPIFTPNNTYPFNNNGFFSSVSCAGSTCIAAGDYSDGSIYRPLLALSHDSGAIWTYPGSITEPIFSPNNAFPFSSNGIFNSASCSGSTCIAVGQYSDGSSDRPLLALSQNSGATWTYPESITAPVFNPNNTYPFDTFGIFNSASCSDSICIAAGRYNDGNVDRPLLALSQNSGATWTYPESITAPFFTPTNTYSFNDSGIFYSASCSGSTCIAVGQYFDGSTVRPLLARSRDLGRTWIYPEFIIEPGFIQNNTHPFSGNSSFKSVSCTGSTCIAVGSYEHGREVRPLLALSQDSGATWSYPESIHWSNFASNNNYNSNDSRIFYSVNCSNSTCIAVGQHSDGTLNRPLLAVSQDSGVTWTYPESINAPIFSPNNTNPYSQNGIFKSSSCFDHTCIAVGHYNDGSKNRPLLALSRDSGATWIYPESINAPIFTPNNTNPFSGGGYLKGARSDSLLLQNIGAVDNWSLNVRRAATCSRYPEI